MALYLPNFPQYVVAYYGLLLAGAVFCPCSPLLSENELKHQLDDCKAKVILVFNAFLPNFEKIKTDTDVEHVIITGVEEALPPFTPISEPEGCYSFQNLIEKSSSKDPEIHIDPKSEVFKEGWLYTGDIGYLDEDGYLFIVDRKKDMLIYKGYNVYPRELEEVLYQHPEVQQCAIIGIPDEEVGEIPRAYVVLNEGENITEGELKAFVNDKVSAYKKIRALKFVSEIPMSGAGKALKRVLQEMEIFHN